MKRLRQNYSGFSAVEAVLIIFVLVILASGGYYVYHANYKAKPVSTAPSTPGASAGSVTGRSQTNLDESTWKTYSSSFEGASFKYPSNWKLTNNGAVDGAINGDSATLTAPDGFEVDWDAPLSGIGGGCDVNADPHVFLDKIIPLSVTGSKNPLSIVVTSSQGSKSLSVVDGYIFNQSGTMPAIGDLNVCMLYPTFESHKLDEDADPANREPAIIMFSAQGAGLDTKNMTDDQYLALPDVQVTEKIFESLTY